MPSRVTGGPNLGTLPETFEVADLNRPVDRNKALSLQTLILEALFSIALAGFFIWTFGLPFAGDHLNPYRLTVVLMLTGFAIFMTYNVARGIPGFRPGVKSLVVDPDGVQLDYGKGEQRHWPWGDPSTEFELLEYPERFSTSALVTPTRFYLISDGRMSALSEAAYRAMLREAETRGLVRGQRIGNPWYKLTLGRPLTRTIRGSDAR